MADYRVPNVVVRETPRETPIGDVETLFAHVSGGDAQLMLYADEDVKDQLSLGEYDPDSDTSYAWPGREAGAVVDPDYVKVYLENARMYYFEDLLSQDETVVPVANYRNRIRYGGDGGFIDNGEDYPRITALLDRDVKAGDGVYIRGVVDGTAYELDTYVLGFAGDTVAATVGAAATDDANESDQSEDVDVTQIAGDTSTLVATASLASYNGLIDGYINETYTVTVTAGSAGGDHTTAVLRLTSASGLDDAVGITPAANGTFFEVGARHFKIKFTGAANLVAGQKWEFVIQDDFDAAQVTSGGTYSGSKDARYIVEVTRGGFFDVDSDDEKPQITVRTDIAIDASPGPVLVDDHSTFVDVGTLGVLIKFTGSGSGNSLAGLRKGDIFLIDVTSETTGSMNEIILGNNMSDTLRTATDLDLRLYIEKDMELVKNRIGFDPQVNWDTSATEITLNSGAIAYDSSWTDGGVEQALSIESATVFVQYRAWRTRFNNSLESIAIEDDLDDAIPGVLHPDNPLKYGVYLARLNAAGVPVYFTACADPSDTAAWEAVLETITGAPETYCLAPCTDDETVLSLFQAHVAAQSGEEVGLERRLYRQLTLAQTRVILSAANTDDENPVLAKVLDDPNTSGTQYTLVVATTDNGGFVAKNVRAGDTVRYSFRESFGEELYDEAVVDAVINEEQIRLVTGLDAPINSAQRIEIWRTMAATEYASEIGQLAGALGDRRVSALWPDRFEASGTSLPGYFMACIMAGKRSGVPPHQPLTNVNLSGATSVERTTELFNSTQLNVMAGDGVCIITQDRSGNIFARHALTTDNTSLNTAEEEMVTNIDSIKRQIRNRMRPNIGRRLANQKSLDRVDADLRALLGEIEGREYGDLGPQLENPEILNLRRSTVNRDTFLGAVAFDAPAPLNRIEIDLVF